MFTQKINKVLLFAILLISFFGMNLIKSEAACPPGYTYAVRSVTVFGCNVNVGFCYKCDPANGQSDIIYEWWRFNKLPLSPPTPCTITGKTWEEIEEEVIRQLNSIVIGSMCTNVPPCGAGSMGVLKYKVPNCYKNVWVDNDVYVQPCDESFCKYETYYCYNSTLGIVVWSTPQKVGIEGTPSCDDPNYREDILDLNVNENNTTSPCYYLLNSCLDD